MTKVIALSLLMLPSCIVARRGANMALDLNVEKAPEHDAKCNQYVPGTHASKLGWLFGGLEHCRCEDESAIIANERGNVQWQDSYLDDKMNSFDYAKKNLFRDAKCMPRAERVYREALADIKKAIGYAATSKLVFLDISYKAQALASFANAFRGESRKTLTRSAFLGHFDCSERALRVPELDDACADSMVTIKKYQTEAASCLEAMHALEHAREFIDGAAFTQAATLVSEAAKIMREKDSRTDAALIGKASEASAALLGIVQGLLPRVEEVIPPF